MKRLLIALALAEILTTPVLAAPGDPRLIQGTIEWPVALASEPVMIVRGDDGRVYSVDVSGAVRHGNVALRGGGRVALLGLEAAKSHELTALVIGSGDAATLARALSQGLTPVTAPAATAATLPATVATPPVTAPPASATAPSTVAAPVAAVATPAPPAAVTVPATAGTPPATAVTPPRAAPAPPAAAPAPAATPAVATTPAPGTPSAPVAAPVSITTPVVAPAPPAAPAPVTTPAPQPAPAATPPATTGTVPPPSANPPVPAGTRVMATPAVASASTERKQWARVDGRVQIVGADASRVLEPPALPDDERDGPTYFLSCLRDGREIAGPCAADVGRDVQEVLAAALRSSVTGRRVSLPPTSHAR